VIDVAWRRYRKVVGPWSGVGFKFKPATRVGGVGSLGECRGGGEKFSRFGYRGMLLYKVDMRSNL
jgi:hypothetical protein